MGERGPRTAQGLLAAAAKSLVDAVLPPRCLSCDVVLDEIASIVVDADKDDSELDGVLLCQLCRDQLALTPERPGYFVYGGVLADLVRRAKYHRDLATCLGLAELFAASVAGDAVTHDVDVVTFVPAPWTRVVARGFDLPALMAERAAARVKRPCVALLRVHRRDARLATAADAEARARLVAGRFAVEPRAALKSQSLRRVLLVDDVVTTGATSVEATAVLAAVGKDVTVRCLAQTPRPGDDGDDGADDEDEDDEPL